MFDLEASCKHLRRWLDRSCHQPPFCPRPEDALASAVTLAELAGVDAVRLGVNEDLKPVREADVLAARRAARRLELRMPPSQPMLKVAQAKSCFVAGTRILMADGSERPIEAVRVGELVRGRTGGAPEPPRARH